MHTLKCTKTVLEDGRLTWEFALAEALPTLLTHEISRRLTGTTDEDGDGVLSDAGGETERRYTWGRETVFLTEPPLPMAIENTPEEVLVAVADRIRKVREAFAAKKAAVGVTIATLVI